MKKRSKGIEKIKSNYGRLFVLPWEIGILLFVITPVFQTIKYSFSSVTIGDKGLATYFIGLDNFKYIFREDPNYLDYLRDTFIGTLYLLPSIVIISVIIGVILNGKFRGRLFFRAMYFLPVIISTGVVLEWILKCTNPSLDSAGVESAQASDLINVEELISVIGFAGPIVTFFQNAISEIFNIVWSSGIQIVLVVAGLQSIPDTLYEVSKVEGASKWQEFWLLTFPMLSRVIMLVIVFTVVELLTDKKNNIMTYVYNLMSTLNYDQSSAMVWFYLLISAVVFGTVILAYNRISTRKWE